jgi:hypothetical protein
MEAAPYYVICDQTGPRAWARANGAGTEVFTHGQDRPTMSFHTSNDVEECLRRNQHDLRQHCSISGEPKWQRTAYLPGQFHPRVQRHGDAAAMGANNPTLHELFVGWVHPGAPMTERYAREFQSSIVSSRELFARMRDVFRYIEPNESHLEVYGHDLRHLLILACTEVESGMKAVLKVNELARAQRNNTIVDYLRLVQPMRLHHWELTLRGYAGFPSISPFAEGDNTRGPSWWRAYNGTKHDRELELRLATLQNAVNSVAAVLIVVLAQFGKSAFRELAGEIPFTVERSPQWEPNEFYIPPTVPGGFDDWTVFPLASVPGAASENNAGG